MTTDTITLACIGGTDQNGATLLSRMIGTVPGFVAVGELGYVWDRALLENVTCGCGEEFRDCPFWTAVGTAAFGGWDTVDAREAVRLRARVKRSGRMLSHPLSLPLILMPWLSRRYHQDLDRYAGLMLQVYRGIHEVSGGRVIVDSMKRPSHVYMMRRLPGVDLRVIHLVRDSRGVAYSSLKWVERQGIRVGPTYRTRRPSWKSAGRWLWINLAFHVLAGLRVPSAFVRYETVVSAPVEELRRIAEHCGRTPEADGLGFVRGSSLELGRDHLIAGNRVRLQGGTLELRTDEEWRSRMGERDRRLVTWMTWPLLRRYGYAIGR